MWVELTDDAGRVGLGETYDNPGAVEAVIHEYRDVVTEPVVLRDGWAQTPDRPGLGTRLAPGLRELPGTLARSSQ